MPLPGALEHERTVAVGKGSDNSGSSPDFFHDALEHVVALQTALVLARERMVAEGFFDAVFQYSGGLGEFLLPLPLEDFGGFDLGGLLVFYGVDGFEAHGHFLALAVRVGIKDVAVVVERAALLFGLGIDFGKCRLEAGHQRR